MTAKDKSNHLHFLARTAMRSYDSLSAAERIKLLRAIALVLPQKEARIYEHTAFVLQKAEEAQYKLFENLAVPPTNNQPT